MARIQAQAHAMADRVRAGAISLEQALTWHLSRNCYPAANPRYLTAACEAVRHMSGEERSVYTPVTLPDGAQVSAAIVVRALRLEAYLDCEQEQTDGEQ